VPFAREWHCIFPVDVFFRRSGFILMMMMTCLLSRSRSIQKKQNGNEMYALSPKVILCAPTLCWFFPPLNFYCSSLNERVCWDETKNGTLDLLSIVCLRHAYKPLTIWLIFCTYYYTMNHTSCYHSYKKKKDIFTSVCKKPNSLQTLRRVQNETKWD